MSTPITFPQTDDVLRGYVPCPYCRGLGYHIEQHDNYALEYLTCEACEGVGVVDEAIANAAKNAGR